LFCPALNFVSANLAAFTDQAVRRCTCVVNRARRSSYLLQQIFDFIDPYILDDVEVNAENTVN
jgi:hypothetical protein